MLQKLGFTHGLGEDKEKNNQSDEYKNVVSKVPEAFQPYVVQLLKGDKFEPIYFDPSQFPDL